MGLELIELGLEVEREFDIRITNEAAQGIATPRQMAAYVQAELLRRLGARVVGGGAGCVSQIAFHRLRVALGGIAGVPRRAVRLETRLADLLPPQRVHAQWAALGRALAIRRLPRLQADRGQALAAWGASGVIGILLCGLALLSGAPLMAVLALVLAAWLGGCLENFLARQIPEGVGTVRALVPYVPMSAGVPPVIVAQDGSLDPAILARVIALTAQISDVPAENIRPDHHFIDDLGMG